ncbi:MAG: bifunctional phosphoglucose/phosphomannose isomerase [Bacteroidia bacterium]|nr:bifunctional phosphoglucose/phosphomannose isomerase [Bacteroidia bacterium]
MKDLIADFTKHLRNAMEIGESATIKKDSDKIRNVLVTGLGGSGIGGTIIGTLIEKELNVPLLVNKDYFLPNWVNEHTLLVVCSYSGNTEETLNALKIAEEKGAKIVAITSGGKLLDRALDRSYDHIKIPGGLPPRAAFGLSFPQLFYMLNGVGLISDSFKSKLQSSIDLLDKEEENIKASAKALAGKLHNKIPIIYSSPMYEGTAVRFRQQINENSKMLCWHHVVPEMNHNELVGWTTKNDDLAVVMFRSNDDFFRTEKRIEITKEIASKYTANINEVRAMGSDLIEQSFYLIHFGDWVSWYLSEIKAIDATEVNVIDYLKSELAKI